MDTAPHREDLILAQKTCDELRAGNNEAILDVYNQYHPFFLGFARKRMHSFDDDRVLLVLDDFWVEPLNAKAICDYSSGVDNIDKVFQDNPIESFNFEHR